MTDSSMSEHRSGAEERSSTSDAPYRYERTIEAGLLQERYRGLPPDTRTGTAVSVAGRMLLRRLHGGLAFGTLVDGSGRVQLFATQETTPRFEEFCHLAIGDWIGATGEIVTTRRGELSVAVSDWIRLAHARRPFPDRWHGLADPDTRYRQRYVDLWVSEEARRTFRLRSRVVSFVRRWLEDRGFVEVETPVLQPQPGGALARPFVTHHNALDMPLYLRIAPELYLKRLIGGGVEKVFELGRVFRNEGIDARHNPEFTMLELYQAYADYTDMMALCEDLLADVARDACGSTTLVYGGRPLDLSPPWRRATMLELVEEQTGVPVDVEMPVGELVAVARRFGVPVKRSWGPGKLVLEIYERTTESALWGPVFVCDYPAEVSPLARPHRSKPGYVERFEPIVAGRELGNAFSELVDPDEQRARFEDQAAQRASGDEEAMTLDEDYLRALEYGLPPTGGLGIGIDRLVMLLADAPNIRDVVLFPTLRPEAH
jgi:lysyl-tRNA synthetase class 2